jgi:hypothetical protein
MNSLIEQIQIEESYSPTTQDWAEYEAWLDQHHTQEDSMTLYEKIVQLQIPHANHCSDLYIPVTPQTTELLKESKEWAESFYNQVDGGLWYSVAFAYDPYWAARGVIYK